MPSLYEIDPYSGSREEDKNVESLQRDGRPSGKRMTGDQSSPLELLGEFKQIMKNLTRTISFPHNHLQGFMNHNAFYLNLFAEKII